MSCNLKPHLEKFLKTVRKYNLINPGDRILVAFSGGPDSVFLLRMLFESRSILKLSLAAAHLHHGIRKVEADRDLEFSKDFAENLGIPFFSAREDVALYAEENKLSVEEAARIVRYRFLEETLDRWGGNKIATAHTLSDSVETVLFNLFRGAGPSGLAGIPPSRGVIIRPIITFTREEIFDFLDQCGIPYVMDSTNQSLDYARNYIRHVIVPAIRKRFPGFESSIAATSEIFRVEKEFFEKRYEYIREKSFKLSLGEDLIVLDTGSLKNYHRAELYWFFKLFLNLDFFHTEEAVNLISKGQGRLSMEGGELIKSYGDLAIIRGQLKRIGTFRFSPPCEVEFRYPNFRIVSQITGDAEEIEAPFVFYWHETGEFEVGPRRPGDRVESVGFKKLKEMFIERKIPSWRRDLWPVIRRGGKILWVPLVYKHRFKHSRKYVKLEVVKVDEERGWIFDI